MRDKWNKVHHANGSTYGEMTIRSSSISQSCQNGTKPLTRRASMCGSVNHSNILHDKTGSRRFLIHDVESIDYQNLGDMYLVYAQAYALYRSGFQYWFDAEDNKKVQSQNLRFEVQTVEEELLLENFQQANANLPGAEQLKAAHLLKRLHGNQLPANAHAYNI